jgi:hypothetical protein
LFWLADEETGSVRNAESPISGNLAKNASIPESGIERTAVL